MKLISSKIKNINIKLKQIKIYKKKKLFLIVNHFKTKNKLIKKNLFFLILIPKTFFFKIKIVFDTMLKKIKNLININLLSFKKGFKNYILKHYLTKSIYNYIQNKNKLIIFYSFSLTSEDFLKFLINFYDYFHTNFYFLYSIYQKTNISNKLYKYLYEQIKIKKKNFLNQIILFKLLLLLNNQIINYFYLNFFFIINFFYKILFNIQYQLFLLIKKA
jgi:hypothetical protein